MAELNSCEWDHTAWETSNIYYLCLCWNSFEPFFRLSLLERLPEILLCFSWNEIVSWFECLNNLLFMAELWRLRFLWSWYIFPWTPIAQKSDAEISLPWVTSMSFLHLFLAVGQVLGRNGSSSGIRMTHAANTFSVSGHLFLLRLTRVI